jgi:effector-binding domain-containing protein
MIRSLLAACAVLLLATPAMATPEPKFTVEKRDGAIELRQYAPMIVAEVTVEGRRSEAANRGFRPLANYIFGDNAPRAKIAMTAPVQQSRGEKIAMTAPVTQSAAGAGTWVVRFIMPEGYSMATLPKPNDPNVRLIEQPGQRVAVIRFSGSAPERVLDEKSAELQAFVAKAGLKPQAAATYAFYDPPWTPSFMRRNEVMIAVE